MISVSVFVSPSYTTKTKQNLSDTAISHTRDLNNYFAHLLDFCEGSIAVSLEWYDNTVWHQTCKFDNLRRHLSPKIVSIRARYMNHVDEISTRRCVQNLISSSLSSLVVNKNKSSMTQFRSTDQQPHPRKLILSLSWLSRFSLA